MLSVLVAKIHQVKAWLMCHAYGVDNVNGNCEFHPAISRTGLRQASKKGFHYNYMGGDS